MYPQVSNPCIHYGILMVWTWNEITGSIFHSMFLHRFVGRTELYICWKKRSGIMKDSEDNEIIICPFIVVSGFDFEFIKGCFNWMQLSASPVHVNREFSSSCTTYKNPRLIKLWNYTGCPKMFATSRIFHISQLGLWQFSSVPKNWNCSPVPVPKHYFITIIWYFLKVF
jgi:hypothetical protein